MNGRILNVTSGGKFLPCWGTIYPGASVDPPVITGTGTCATSSTQKGTAYYGQFTCTGSSGAATVTITPTQAATNNFLCVLIYDSTTLADTFTHGALSSTACNWSAAALVANDVIVFEMIPY